MKDLEMLSVVTEVLYTFTAIMHTQQTILEWLYFVISCLLHFKFSWIIYTVGCFSKDTLLKNKCTPHHATGGYLGRSYPEEEAERTSLGGPFRHFDKNRRGGGIGGGI